MTLIKKSDDESKVKMFYSLMMAKNQQVKDEFIKTMSRMKDNAFKKEVQSIKFFTNVL